MTAHLLDRPVWTTLSTRQAHLAQGDGRALRLRADYGLFAAAADASPASLKALANLIAPDDQVATVEAQAWPEVPDTRVVTTAEVCQMVAPSVSDGGTPDFEIVELTDDDADLMLALATLTKPGPFFRRTHQLGGFVGVKDRDGRLLAMAGERMKPPGFTEVSGVCTQPDCRGRGYAGALMRLVAGRILARGETPFLHTYAHNTGAIALYEALGFSLRHVMIMTVLARA